MSSPISIRPAGPNDYETLGRLGSQLTALHHDLDAARFLASKAGTPRAYADFLEAESGRGGVFVLVAERHDGTVVGYAYAGLEGTDWMALRGPAGVIYDLVVDPDRRRQGVGAKLLKETSARLFDLGAPRVVLFTAERNDAARRLFAASGFRPTMVEMTREAPKAFDRK